MGEGTLSGGKIRRDAERALSETEKRKLAKTCQIRGMAKGENIGAGRRAGHSREHAAAILDGSGRRNRSLA